MNFLRRGSRDSEAMLPLFRNPSPAAIGFDEPDCACVFACEINLAARQQLVEGSKDVRAPDDASHKYVYAASGASVSRAFAEEGGTGDTSQVFTRPPRQETESIIVSRLRTRRNNFCGHHELNALYIAQFPDYSFH